MKFNPLWCFPFLLASALVPLASADGSPAAAVVQLQRDFRKLGFGMFIHYNMATYHGVQWVEGYPSPSTFDPGGKIDTDAWADAAKSAGMTYGVLTAKHVAGFCLWDSKHTSYDNVGPDKQGRIIDSSLKALAEFPDLRQKHAPSNP